MFDCFASQVNINKVDFTRNRRYIDTDFQQTENDMILR